MRRRCKKRSGRRSFAQLCALIVGPRLPSERLAAAVLMQRARNTLCFLGTLPTKPVHCLEKSTCLAVLACPAFEFSPIKKMRTHRMRVRNRRGHVLATLWLLLEASLDARILLQPCHVGLLEAVVVVTYGAATLGIQLPEPLHKARRLRWRRRDRIGQRHWAFVEGARGHDLNV